MTTRRIHLNAFDMSCVGHQSPGVWRHPDDQSHRYRDLDYWTELARLLERGGFDSLFLADVLGIYDVYEGSPDPSISAGVQVPNGDPTAAISAMAAVTERLGFAITVSLTYEQPYSFARRMTTLDHLTRGRVGWNIVTGYLESAARNLGLDRQLDHDERYELGEEFLEVCYKLWESSWQDDAVLRDKASGVFADPSRVHPVEHKGTYFSVPGAFLCEPSPQRTPVLFQAGSSSRGRAFAARHGEGVFVNSTRPEKLRPLVDDIRRSAANEGRDPRSVKVFNMVTVITGATDEEARAKHEEYRRYASLDGALALFGGWTGIDGAEFDPDEPLRYVESGAMRSVVESLTVDEPDREWTFREIAEHLTVGGRGAVIVGSPETVVDELERWVEVADIDGFNFAYAITPGTFEDLVEHVVPELRRRGRVPTESPGATLREQLYGAGQRHLREDHPGHRHKRQPLGGDGEAEGSAPLRTEASR